jgi:hypothetical protein
MENGFSLFSITKLKLGWQFIDKGNDGFLLTNGERELKFDIRVQTPKGYVWVMYAPPWTGWREYSMCSAASTYPIATAPTSEVKMKASPYHVMHAKLEHMGKDATRILAKNSTGYVDAAAHMVYSRQLARGGAYITHTHPLGVWTLMSNQFMFAICQQKPIAAFINKLPSQVFNLVIENKLKPFSLRPTSPKWWSCREHGHHDRYRREVNSTLGNGLHRAISHVGVPFFGRKELQVALFATKSVPCSSRVANKIIRILQDGCGECIFCQRAWCPVDGRHD